METAFIITDKNKMPYAVVSILKGGTEFHPLSENAKTWSGWMNEEYAVRQVSKGQLTATLDNSMSVEGPIAYARNNKLRLDELIAQAKKIPVVEQIEGRKSVDELHVISILDAQLHQLDDSEWHNAIQFKAGAFVADSNKASMNFEVKRTRALWDAGLSIPGTNRRGGWRCPPGMAFGGQITDRFGRNCGAGLARRLANGLQNVGERIENADDAKRGKRVARRNAAMGRRLAGAGAIERGAGRIADALETNLPKAPAGRVVGAPVRKIRGAGVVERGAGRLADALETKPPKVRGAGRIERGAGRLADALETKPPKRRRIGRIERGAGRLADALETRPPKVKPKRTIVREADKTPIRDNAIRRGLRDIAPDLMAYAEGAEAGVRGRRNPVYEGTPEKLPSGGVRKPKAPKAAAATAKPRKPRVAPVAPKAPKAPKEPKLVDDVSGIPVPKGLPRNNESLSDYMTRKYNEHQEQIRLIQKAGGKAGFLKRPEWNKFHGPEVEANWKKKNAGRAARATASDAKVPKKPAAPKKPAVAKMPFDSPKKGFNDLLDAQRARAFHEVDINRAQAHKIVRYDGKYFVVEDGEVIRANAAGANLLVVPEPPRPPARPPVVVTPPTPVVTPPATPKKPRKKGTAVDSKVRAFAAPHKNAPKSKQNDNKLGAVGKDGLPDAGGIPVGNKGLNTKEDAIAHLANGGNIADIPDDFLQDALFGNANENKPQMFLPPASNAPAGTKRFDVVANKEGGINGGVRDNMHMFTDRKTGKKYYLKYQKQRIAANEDVHEIVGNNIAARMGFAVGEFRFAGAVRKDGGGELRPILFEHVGNYVDGKIVEGRAVSASRIKASDRIRATLLDYAIINHDRHGGNFFGAEQGGDLRFVPIDPSLGFNAIWHGGGGGQVFKGPMDGRDGMAKWVDASYGGKRNEFIQTLRDDFSANRITRDEVKRVIAEVQEALRQAEKKKSYSSFVSEALAAAGTPGKPRSTADVEKYVKISADARLKFLMQTDAGALADIILTGS